MLASCASPVLPPPATPSTPSAYACPAGDLFWEGNAPEQVLNDLIASYGVECRNRSRIQYTATDDAVQSFSNGLVQAATTDVPADDKQLSAAARRCAGAPPLQVPLDFASVAVVHNVEGVSQLTLSPTLLAKILSGVISQWDDPELVAANPGIALPSASITVFTRADSGTNLAMTQFLAGAAPDEWPAANVSRLWRGKGENLPSAQRVVDSVGNTPNSLAFVAYPDTLRSKVRPVALGSGQVSVLPTEQTMANAAAAARPASETDLRLSVNDTALVADRYPVNLVSYMLVCPRGLPTPQSSLARDFMSYLVGKEAAGQWSKAGYAPFPEELRSKFAGALARIQ